MRKKILVSLGLAILTITIVLGISNMLATDVVHMTANTTTKAAAPSDSVRYKGNE